MRRLLEMGWDLEVLEECWRRLEGVLELYRGSVCVVEVLECVVAL